MRVFALPALLATLSFGGLIVALLDDGLFDALGWLGLGIPVASIPLAMLRARQAGRGRTAGRGGRRDDTRPMPTAAEAARAVSARQRPG